MAVRVRDLLLAPVGEEEGERVNEREEKLPLHSIHPFHPRSLLIQCGLVVTGE